MYAARPLRSTRRLQNLTATLPSWWKIENKVGAPTMVSIYDEIGLYGVSAAGFLNELAGVTGDIELHLNSPGGDVFDGIAIYNQLRNAGKRGTVRVVVDGLAASAASFIAQAASPGHLEMAPHSQMMIHDGFAMGIGNAADLRDLAEQLDKASDNIAAIYADRTGKPAAHWRDMMRRETWLTDTEAVAAGLADRVQGDVDNSASGWDLSVYGRFQGKSGKPAPMPTRQDPDGDGDDDTSAEGDTDHDYVDADGRQIKPLPGDGGQAKGKKAKKAKSVTGISNADVDNSAWDADKAWHNGVVSDDPEKFYEGICAGKRTGDPSTQNAWALPYKYHPDDPPNAAGVRAALARLNQTRDLINREEAGKTLQAAMQKINPDYEPDNHHVDGGLLAAVLIGSLKGENK